MDLRELGKFLQRARRAKRIRLKDMAADTKILPGILKAIEEGDRDALPEEPYLRAFLRVYAQQVGLDEEEVIKRYEERIPPPVPMEVERPAKMRWSLVGVVVVLVAILGGSAILFLPSRRVLPPTSPEEVAVVETTIASHGEKKVSLPSDSTQQEKVIMPEEESFALAESLRLEIVGLESTWVSVRADGRRPYEIILGPAERKSWSAKDGFLLTLGKGDGVEMWLNGRNLKQLKGLRRSRVVKNLILDRETAKELVAEE